MAQRGSVLHCMAFVRCSLARARLGYAGRRSALQGQVMLGKAWRGRAGPGELKPGTAGRSKVRQGKD